MPELLSVPLIFAELLAAVPPEIPALIVGAGQLYVISAGIIPSVTSTGIVVKLPPLHIVAVRSLTAGTGLTVTVTVNVRPVHGPETGVTVYVAVPAELPVLVSAPVMLGPAPADPAETVPVITGAFQLYVVPAGTTPSMPLVGLATNVAPLQIALVMAFIAGLGLTVIDTVNVAPVQLPDTGVTVYMAICGELFGLTSVPVIAAPDPALPPESPPVTVGAVQVYVVPAGTMPLVTSTGVTVKVPSLHIASLIAVMDGLGSTSTVTENGVPLHPLAVGVTEYVALCWVLVGLISDPLMLAALVPDEPPVMPPVRSGDVQV